MSCTVIGHAPGTLFQMDEKQADTVIDFFFVYYIIIESTNSQGICSLESILTLFISGIAGAEESEQTQSQCSFA